MRTPPVILGVPFFPEPIHTIESRWAEWLSSKAGWNFIVTPNPEFLVRGISDASFREILIHAEQRLVDGFGLWLVANVLWRTKLSRYSGADAVLTIVRMAAARHQSVYLLGAAPGVAQRAGDTLMRLVPGLAISGAETGDGEDSPNGEEGVVERIKRAQPGVLLVAYGAPQQELWLWRHRENFPSVRIAMGIGGTLDFLSGTVPRAPQRWRKLGFEWLYRLLHQPRARWQRIFSAVIIFPFVALADRLGQLLRRQ